ncbi:hypothetical protein [Nocardioides pacificus]
MDDRASSEPLLGGRGLVMIDDFCRATGLDRATVEELVREAKVEGAFHRDGRVAGLFDDVLPTAEQLGGWDLTVRGDYDPEDLRSYVGDSDDTFDAEVPASSGSSWTMRWDDGS